jgi:hypothetical protein
MKKESYSVLLEEKFRKEFLEIAIAKFGSQRALAEYLRTKIKGRKISRENVKDWIKGKHIYGWDILIPISILRELCKINSQDLQIVLTKSIKFNPPWYDPKKRGDLIIIKNIPLIKEINNRNYLDLASIIPSQTLTSIRSRKKLPLFTKIKETEVELWSEANWKKSSIKLKRFIELNDLFFIGSAIYSSEGTTKIGKYNDSISLGNSEPSIINLFFEWLDSFLIGYKFSVKIEYNGKKCDERAVIKFWKEKVHYIKNSKIKVIQRDKYGSSLINNMGTLNIKISNTVLKSFLIKLLEMSKKITLTKKIYLLDYLKGLLASEGSVSRPVLKEVTIGCINGKQREFIKRLLNRLEIKFTEGKNQLSLTSWKNFFLLYKNDIFFIKQINGINKKETFIEGFKNHQTTKGFVKLKRFTNKEFNAKEWQKEFELKYYNSSHKFLEKFIKNKLLLTRFEDNTKFYYLNPKKIDFLKKIWETETL